MAYKGQSNFTGAGAQGTGGGTSKTPKGSKMVSGFDQTTTFVETVWKPGNDFRNTTEIKTTTVSNGDSVIRGINTPI